MYILSAKQIQDADSHAIKKVGIPSIVLMENACRASSSIITEAYPREKFPNVIVVAGKGNNGGDGIGVARLLSENSYDVTLVLLGGIDTFKKDPKINFNIYANLGYKYFSISDPVEFSTLINNKTKENTILVDAIFGTGINKLVKNSFYYNIFEAINSSKLSVVAIDVPSGLSDQFKPEGDSVVRADMTVAFQTLKTAHIYPDSNSYCGKLIIADIGIPEKSIRRTDPKVKMIVPADLEFIKQKRSSDGHKGSFGHCLNISGSLDKPGASILSSIAILKSGSGLCTTAVLPENRDVIINALPELMTKTYTEPEELTDIIKGSDIVLSGPGIGMDPHSEKIVELILSNASSPIVLDADAINIISNKKELLKKNSGRINIILTPHPGEFSKLTGKSKEEISLNRIRSSSDFAVNNGIFVILKGHHTVIASPDGDVYVNQAGNPGMATAGSGDVLSGVITGFLAQFSKTIPIKEILAASVFVHGYAGDFAMNKNGEIAMTASDIIKYIPKAILKINDFKSKFKVY